MCRARACAELYAVVTLAIEELLKNSGVDSILTSESANYDPYETKIPKPLLSSKL